MNPLLALPLFSQSRQAAHISLSPTRVLRYVFRPVVQCLVILFLNPTLCLTLRFPRGQDGCYEVSSFLAPQQGLMAFRPMEVNCKLEARRWWHGEYGRTQIEEEGAAFLLPSDCAGETDRLRKEIKYTRRIEIKKRGLRNSNPTPNTRNQN